MLAAPPPVQVVHADWGSSPAKRRQARAVLAADNRYRIGPVEGVSDPDRLLEQLLEAARGQTVLIGFDFPIGVPRSYAERVGITDFRSILPLLGQDEWHLFYEVASTPEEITARRPFYPSRPGGTRQAHLMHALNAASMHDLLRRCERGLPWRPPASSLFWTLGPKQVGKAAIAGWRDVLSPAIRAGMPVSLWPYDGPLNALLKRRGLVVVETYPAESYRHLGIRVRRKGDARHRAAAAPELFAAAKSSNAVLSPAARRSVERGFPSDDDFDACAGLLAMLLVVRGIRKTGEPEDDNAVGLVEGWILGQAVA
jgi:hypothetical protein